MAAFLGGQADIVTRSKAVEGIATVILDRDLDDSTKLCVESRDQRPLRELRHVESLRIALVTSLSRDQRPLRELRHFGEPRLVRRRLCGSRDQRPLRELRQVEEEHGIEPPRPENRHEIKGREGNCDASHLASRLPFRLASGSVTRSKAAKGIATELASPPLLAPPSQWWSRDQRSRRELRQLDHQNQYNLPSVNVTRSKAAKGIATI
jgi:hypothetical protein